MYNDQRGGRDKEEKVGRIQGKRKSKTEGGGVGEKEGNK